MSKKNFVTTSRAADSKGIIYKPLEGRVFENKFDPTKVARHVPKAEKDTVKKIKKVKDEPEREPPRPPAVKVAYTCTYCNEEEVRYQSDIYDMNTEYICRKCIKSGSGGAGRVRSRRVQ